MATDPTSIFGDMPQLPGLAGEIMQPDSFGGMNKSVGDMIDASLLRPIDEEEAKIIDKLGPDTELGQKTMAKLEAMRKFSATEMRKHYNRWNFMERKVQAFINDQDYEVLLESLSEKGALPPEPVQVVVPYTYATLHAAATYISSVLLGRKPLFPLMSSTAANADNAPLMEAALQYNLDASNGHETLWQQIWDGLNYSFGCTRIGWEEKTGPSLSIIGGQRTFQDAVTFAGNVLTAVDPYDFFPDPRVPLHKCSKDGDFLFTRMKISEAVLKDLEFSGTLKWVKEACAKRRGEQARENENASQRRVRIGEGNAELITPANVTKFKDVYEGTVRLRPKDWKLGEGEMTELWKFTWTSNGAIMQAEPLGMLHAQHPYAIQEPNSLGHDFMSLSLGEMITVFQDILSWLVSSRMENVRAAISNSFVVDPARVEINDIRSSAIGRVIRLKQAAMGLPVQDAIKQLAVTDVTGGHLADIQTMRLLADSTTGVNDNLRGIQTQGGRRSATEARMSMQAGASRLSQLAVRISSQSLLPMANQMIMNIQQFIPENIWKEVTGAAAEKTGVDVTTEMMVGNFNYVVSDGSLPLDKMALTEVWKEIFFGIARDPELRQNFDLIKVFKHVAELGGAKNIEAFQKSAAPLPQIAGPGEQPGGQAVGAAIPPMPFM